VALGQDAPNRDAVIEGNSRPGAFALHNGAPKCRVRPLDPSRRSELLHLIYGLEVPDEGEVRVDGRVRWGV
jgi:hypothetical protein